MNTLFILANFGITIGYLFVAVTVLPYVDVRREWVRWAGIVFFFTCGITHVEMAVYALLNSHHASITWWSTVNHLVQIVAVWLFVVGLYKEFVGDSLSLGHTDRETLQQVADGVHRLEQEIEGAQSRADAAYDYDKKTPGEAADAGMMSGGEEDEGE